MNVHADVRYPISLVLSRQWLQSGQWRFPRWEVVVVLPQHTTPDTNGLDVRHVHTGEDGEHYLWSGLWLELFRDGLQGYYQNLTAIQPSLFVLCHDGDSKTGLAPVSVSANHADAEDHMESDGIVLTTPLVLPFSSWVAEYILDKRSILDQQLADERQSKKGKRRHV
jgi:hypothetical protein